MKQKVELLAPAGSKEALQAAVHSGCDAVYIGGRLFGARAFAQNFDDQAMAEAVRYAHRYGVNVYVTVNTLIKDQEMEECLAYVASLQDMDVDALIIQDLGLLDAVHQRFPDLELHASTQMHIHNRDGLFFLKEMGIQRAVLARETTIEQIRDYANAGIDLEVFVHGAMCVSYSGQCLMSSRLFDRSGNRGACAQPCRMAYELLHQNGRVSTHMKVDDAYLLSLKDMNTLTHIPQLLEAGITSFKIEGRMKSPEYVAQTVKAYREAIDACLFNQKYVYDAAKEKELLKVFNRGFSAGHLFHSNHAQLVNMHRPNHMGIPIGTVLSGSRQRMRIKLCDDICQGDGIRVIQEPEDYGCMINRMYDKQNRLIKQAGRGDIVEIEKNGFVAIGSAVIKSLDKKLMETVDQQLHQLPKRIPITMSFVMEIKSPARLQAMDEEGHIAEAFSSVHAETAYHTSLDRDRIIQQLIKCGDTCFTVSDITVENDEQATMPIKELNAMRRQVLQALQEQREIHHPGRRIAAYHRNVPVYPQKTHIRVEVATEEQVQAALEAGIQEIYSRHADLVKQYPMIHRLHDRVHPYPYHIQKGDAVGEVGAFQAKKPVSAEISLNITNAYTAAFLHTHNAESLLLSVELKKEEVAALIQEYRNRYQQEPLVGIMAYGRLELMVTRYCVVSAALKNGQLNCGLCRQPGYYVLKDRKGRSFPLLHDALCNTHILEEHPLDQGEAIAYYKQAGVRIFQLCFTLEDACETASIIHRFQQLIM